MIANIKTICQQIQNTEAGFDVYSNRPQTDIDMKAETGPGEGGGMRVVLVAMCRRGLCFYCTSVLLSAINNMR